MDSNKKNLLVTIADQNFIDQAKQLFSSVYFNAGWQGDYLLLACGISDEDLAWFKNKGILVYSQPFLGNSLLGIKNYPPIVLSKFYLFQEYFKKWQKIIYLDADILVYASLDRLQELAGFNASQINTFRLRDEFIDNRQKTKEIRKKYCLWRRPFSTGVLVFDSNLISEKTFEELMELYCQSKDICQYQEESVLNLFFYKKWKKLSLMYNTIPAELNNYYGVSKSKILAFIVHFPCVKIKPWNSESPYYKEWLDNLNWAEEINLNKRPSARKIFSDQAINRYLRYIKFKESIYFIRWSWLLIDKQLGRLGLVINRKNPKLYNLISRKNGKQ